MNYSHTERKESVPGFTLVELLLTVGIIGLLAGLLGAALPAALKRTRTHKCSTNLHSFGVALISFADDHDGKLRLGALSPPNSMLAGLSNNLSSPKILVCPTDNQLITPWANGGSDKLRVAARAFPGLQNSNVSYFYSGPPEFGSRTVLAGDRNLCHSSFPAPTGPISPPHVVLTIAQSNSYFAWNRFLHELKGNVAMGDGSVLFTTSEAIHQAVTSQPLWPGNKVSFSSPNDIP